MLMIREYTHVFPSGSSVVMVGFVQPDGGIKVTNYRYDPAPRFKSINFIDLTGKPAIYIHIAPQLVA